MLIKYSEIFKSIQGEGKYTGVTTIWVRLFACNLNCDGFGQKDPTDKTTYILPYKDFNIGSVSNIEQLPVWKYGCDSSYSWSTKFKNLQHNETSEQICDKIRELLTTKTNPEGMFNNSSENPVHLCFTGGEPLLPRNQKAVLEILKSLEFQDNFPDYITFETNGTQILSDELVDYLKGALKVTFSISPKLFTVSGEKRQRAIRPDVIKQYYSLCYDGDNDIFEGYFKFVVDGSQRSWDELIEVIDIFNAAGSYFPVYIMKSGATKDGQTGDLENYISEADVCRQAMELGYYYTTRAHVHIFGNKLGT